MMHEACRHPRAPTTPELVMTEEQRLWLQDSQDSQYDQCASPKVMYPRLLGRPPSSSSGAPCGAKMVSFSGGEVLPADYLDRLSPRDLSTTGLNATDLNTTGQSSDDVEYSEPSADLEALLRFLDELTQAGSRLTELTYIVNNWKLGGLIPLKHHGFVIKAGRHGFLTLDFTRRGILWDTFEEYPDYPEGTVLARRHRIDFEPAQLKLYCQETQPFSWPGNDCSAWSKGLLKAARVRDHVEESSWPFACSCMDNCGSVDSIAYSYRSAI